jgi:DNA-binding NtrC family response regulator
MTHETVVLLGNLQVGTQQLSHLILEFGWSLEKAADLEELRDRTTARTPVAILFDAKSLGLSWKQALRLVREVEPRALLIPCHRFSDCVSWPELSESGAFHSLAIPFEPAEVRQSLGFTWSALRRAARVPAARSLECATAAVA